MTEVAHADGSPLDLRGDTGARHARRRESVVDVRFARTPGVLVTREGPVRHAAGDALLTGAAGERWPVRRAVFELHYRAAPGTLAGGDGRYLRNPQQVLALQLDAARTVATRGGDPLQGRAGDWLLQYAPGEFGIVSADIFAATYELQPPGELG